MSWLELRIDSTPQTAELIENILLTIDAQAVTYTDAGDQPILEPGVGEMPLWPEIVLVALFDGQVDTTYKTKELLKHYTAARHHSDTDLNASNHISPNSPLESALNLRWNILEDRVWEREWLKHHKPTQFGNAFWVFHEDVKDETLPTLLLDPGLAFGTGSHPTTALCLEWIATQDWRNKTLIDYGCGSGILAVAAVLLGCESAQCTDIDPQALLATKSNFSRNKVSREAFNLFIAGQEPSLRSDILVANILAGPLVQLAEIFAEKVSPGGSLCLSGILAEQEQSITEAYSAWFCDLKVVNKEGWLRVTGTRKDL